MVLSAYVLFGLSRVTFTNVRALFDIQIWAMALTSFPFHLPLLSTKMCFSKYGFLNSWGPFSTQLFDRW